MIKIAQFTFKVVVAHKENDPVFMKLANSFEDWCKEQGHLFGIVLDYPTTEARPYEELK